MSQTLIAGVSIMRHALTRSFAFAAAISAFAASGALFYAADAAPFSGKPALEAQSLATEAAQKRIARKPRLGLTGQNTSAGGAGCHGAINCADLSKTLIKNGNTCKSWTCNNDVDGKPSCWCDL
ncbi:MAG: hypothetical protein ACT4OU_13430 [Hyphomicrobium sp.]